MSQELRAEMTATVWKVLVTEGDPVSDGDEIAILESMKMEIPIYAEMDGVVTQLKIKPNDSVTDGDLLAVISKSAG